MSSTDATRPKLFQAANMRGLALSSRVVVAPMCTWLASPDNNEATEETFVHYTSLAMGNPGLLIFESNAVEYRGRLQPEDLGIYHDRHVAPLKRINDFIHANSPTKTAIQLGHGGRKSPVENFFAPIAKHIGPGEKYGSQPISASAIAHNEHYPVPTEMTRRDMNEVKTAYVSAARRAVEAGFDAIEIHCGFGMLLCSFLSPVSNQRSDEFGGSRENRARFPLEVIKAVRETIPSTMPLLVRLSAVDFVDRGTTIEDSIEYAKMMKEKGVDVIDVISGGVAHDQKIPETPFFQLPFADKIKKGAKIDTICGGGFTTGEEAENALVSDQASFVAVARAALRDPYWPRNQAQEMGTKTWYPKYQAAAYFSARKLAAAAARTKA